MAVGRSAREPGAGAVAAELFEAVEALDPEHPFFERLDELRDEPLVSGSSWWAGERGDSEMVHLGLVAGAEAPAASWRGAPLCKQLRSVAAG